MVEEGLASTMRVAHKTIDDPTIIGPEGLAETHTTIAQILDQQAWRLQRSPTTTWRSPAVFGALSARRINASDADIVHLHWVTDGFLSIREIGRITKPVVWSLVDMWPFAGTEHYGSDTPNARWRTGYTKANRPPGDHGLDMDRIAWQSKRRSWRRPMHIVTSNAWMRDRVTASALFRGWPVHQIPHVIDTDAFQPADAAVARARLSLPMDAPLILFVSSGGISDARKGWDLLERALPTVREHHPDVEVVVAGPPTPGYRSASGVPIRWQGHVAGDAALATLYCAVDVSAVPSREDNMPLAAMEAQTCGRPVVAFRIGGLPDIVEHLATGYLAQPFDSDDLAKGLIQALDDSRHDGTWSSAARRHALDHWSTPGIIASYLDVYREALA